MPQTWLRYKRPVPYLASHWDEKTGVRHWLFLTTGDLVPWSSWAVQDRDDRDEYFELVMPDDEADAREKWAVLQEYGQGLAQLARARVTRRGASAARGAERREIGNTPQTAMEIFAIVRERGWDQPSDEDRAAYWERRGDEAAERILKRAEERRAGVDA